MRSGRVETLKRSSIILTICKLISPENTGLIAAQHERAQVKAYKFKIRASQALTRKFEATLSLCAELYNGGLQERRDAYRMMGRTISYVETRRFLKTSTSEAW